MQLSIKHSRPIEQARQSVINQKVQIQKTIFGVHLLKKTDNKFLKEAREQSKQAQILGDSLMQDKIEELKALRQNIQSLTPKTVSSHSSDLVEMPDVDYNDPESFRKAQKLLEQKQKERETLKKLKKEEEEKKKLEEKSN